MKRTPWLALAAGFLVLLAADTALAQAVGGGGGAGLFDQAVDWFLQNIARGLIMFAFAGIAVMLLAMRFHPLYAGAVVAAGIVLANLREIAGFFPF
jgi:hypothetical protein